MVFFLLFAVSVDDWREHLSADRHKSTVKQDFQLIDAVFTVYIYVQAS